MNNTCTKTAMLLPAWVYVIGLLLYVYLFVSISQFNAGNRANLLVAGMYFIEFGIHEASHLVFMFLPAILVAAAGSIGEIGFVLLMLFAAAKAKAYFAMCFVSLWLMLALKSVSNYMADARAQQLPLMGPGETVQHDWNFIFTQLGWLEADTAIGGALQIIGTVIGVLSLLLAAYLFSSR